MILAAVALVAAEAGYQVIVVTTNPGHLGRFVDARDWKSLAVPPEASPRRMVPTVIPPAEVATGTHAASSGWAAREMIRPPTDAEDVYGKAYPIREGESLVDWPHRGSVESGEAREKFQATLFRLMRVALRNLVFGGPPTAEQLATLTPEMVHGPYRTLRGQVVTFAREAGLSEWTAELLPAAVEWAYTELASGPNVSELIVDRMSVIVDPSGRGSLEVLERIKESDPMRLGELSAEAARWARDAITAAKVAPDNPYGNDDEAIASAILAKLRAGRRGPDEFTMTEDA